MSFGYTASVVLLTAVAVSIIPRLLTPSVPVHVNIEVAPGWEKVGHVFRNIIEENPSRGYAFSIYHRGEMVVDLYGGYSDFQAWVPWQEDTLGFIFSATKGISAICIALLVDRGLLDYKKPISEYWPEFDDESEGRDIITLEMLLSHQAGLVTFSEEWSIFDLINDPEKVSKIMLKTKLDWEPGKKHGYHMLTYGLYINEIIVRVDPQHRTLDQFFIEEIVEPLEMDAMIGLPHEEYYRTVRFMPASLGLEDLKGFILDNGWKVMSQLLIIPNSIMRKAFYKEAQMDGIINSPEYRRAALGSSHGFGTARDFAKLYGVLAAGGIYNNKVIMSEETIQGLAEVLVSGVDHVMGIYTSYGRGTSPVSTPVGSVKFGFPGAGGMMSHGDIKHKLGFAFMTTKMYTGLGQSPQFSALEKAMYDCVIDIEKKSGFR